MRILFAGVICGSIRAQNEIKIISERTVIGDIINIWSPNFCLADGKSNNIMTKCMKFLYNRIILVMECAQFFVKYFFADIIFVLPMNHAVAALALRLKKYINRRVIVDLYISLYTTYLDRNCKNPSFSKLRKFKRIDKIILEKADRIIMPWKYEVLNLCDKLGVDYSNINLRAVPLTAIDRGICCTKQEHPVFKIAWWGVWIPLHGLENIIQACKILKERDIQFELDLYGTENPERFVYIRLINELGLSDVIHVYTDITFLNAKLEPLLKEECDLALGHFGTSDKAKAVCTNKLFDALTMGLTVLTQKNNTTLELFGDIDFIYYSETNPEDIANAVIKIKNEKKYLEPNIKARNYMLKHFNEKNINTQILDIVNEMCADIT
jgi:glycosyltransferase involved in cell wall biosynthesis